MKKKVVVKEFVEQVRTIEVVVEVEDEYDDGYVAAVEQLNEVGLSAEDVEEAGMRLIHDFEYVGSTYEPEYQ